MTERQSIDRRPSANEMNRRFAVFPIMASPQLFAVNGNDFALGQFTDGSYPIEEAALKLFRI